ncbi:MAG: NAD(+) kinase [Acidobacteriales bacterium]|nr:MAG: NAD(+) kinase [Terriglobales bacterium]
MPDIKTVGVIAKPNTEAAAELVPALIEWLTARGLELRLDEVTAAYAGRTSWLSRDELPDGCDFIIVLGGDGTLLAAARAVGGREVPLFAVNLGGLGFLTTITADDLHAKLEGALRGEFRIGKRRMLHCDLVRGGEAVSEYEALNDVVLSKASIARMIDLETHADQQLVCRYKADGLVVSTPTGSTAYSLAAGGPIIFPSVDCLCITPICPHMLTNRPVIVPHSSVIRIRVCGGDDETFLTIDGQVGEPLKRGDVVVCRSSAQTIRLVRPPNLRFFDVLREKLSWGER